MFAKPFRVKSQTKLKGSDKKRLKTSISKAFPDLVFDFTSKDDLEQAKIITSDETILHLHLMNGQPLFIEMRDGQLCPTVYALWNWPELLPVFPTWPEVTKKIANGADLMLPGVVVDLDTLGPRAYLKLDRGAFIAINTVANSSAFAVGTTALSSQDMFMAGKRGKAINVIHFYGDQLWSFGQKAEMPFLGPPESVSFLLKSSRNTEEEPEPEEQSAAGTAQPSPNDENELESDEVQEVTEELKHELNVEPGEEEPVVEGNTDSASESSGPEVMNNRLEWAFLQAWRTSARKLELPVSSTQFFQRHMVPQCPNQPLQVKKSSYKKFSVFLKHMQSQGIVSVESRKGEDIITQVDRSNEKLRQHEVIEVTAKNDEEDKKNEASYERPQITRMHSVTAAVQPFFIEFGVSKGTALSREDIRGFLREHVGKFDLKRGKLITLDCILGAILKTPAESNLGWDVVLDRIIALMSPCHKVSLTNGEEVIRKGNIKPITISTAMRSGNKKVTLIKNLEQPFLIDPAEFAHACQVGVAASAGVQIDEAAGSTNANKRLVLVQGDQVRFVTKLLLETYKVDRGYIEGGQEGKKGGKKGSK